MAAASVKDSDFDQIGVKALSDTQLQITTQGPLSYFLSASGLAVLRAVPKEAIMQFGNAWTTPGKIMTNGPFVLDTWNPAKKQEVFMRNTFYPKDVNDNYGGNVERVIVSETADSFALYQKNQTDLTGANSQMAVQFKDQLVTVNSSSLVYFGFMYDKPPFDKVEVRRAFSAAIDRQAYVISQVQGQGIPMAHLMPPGVFGAVPVNEVGIGQASNLGFDPDYAKKQLADAGYPACKNLPQITLLTESASDGAFLQKAIQTSLGCPSYKIQIVTVDYPTLTNRIKPGAQASLRPNMFSSGWGSDYLDAQNWMHDLLGCNTENDLKRPCNDAIDGKIDAASKEPDATKRSQMYRDLEDAFFGQDGEFPLAPLYLNISLVLVKPWLTGPIQTDSAVHWNVYVIDQPAQLAARSSKKAQ